MCAREGITPMYISFDELMALPNMKTAKVIAGRGGLSHTIRWYHIIEIEDMANWIGWGTLVFLTGVALNDTSKSLINIVETLNKKHASGLVINIGEYIADISKDVVEKADQFNLPIIVVPSEIKLMDLTYQLGQLLFRKDSQIENVNSVLTSILFGTENGDDEDLLTAYGYDPHVDYAVALFSARSRVPHAGSSPVLDINFIYEVVDSVGRQFSRSIFVLNKTNDPILFVPFFKSETKEDWIRIFHEIQNRLAEHQDHLEIIIGVGSAAHSSADFRTSYHHAKVALKVADFSNESDTVVFFKDISLFRIIDWDNRDQMHQIVEDYLGNLTRNSELIDTLEFYLQLNGNMKKTSIALHLHINSVKYRMNIIRQTLPMNLDEMGGWYKLQTALFLYHYLTLTSHNAY